MFIDLPALGVGTTRAALATIGIEPDWFAGLSMVWELKFVVPAALLLGGWCRPPGLVARAADMLRDAFGIVLTLALCRALANNMPFRPRPLVRDPGMFAGIGDAGTWMSDWSSLPSDHAALGAALATAAWRHSRPLGAVSFVWVILLVCLPRIARGAHDWLDIVAGLAIGVAVVLACARLPVPALVDRMAHRFAPLVGVAVFLLLQQVITLFNGVRQIGRALRDVAG